MSLTDWQVQVGDVVLGQGDYLLSVFDHEKPGTTAGDVQLPGRDGVRFGRDTLGGTVITVEGAVAAPSPAAAFDALAAWRSAWQADTERSTPGAVVPLLYAFPGRQGVVFGRPRRFTPASLRNAVNGHIPVAADFQCADHRWYEQAEQVATLGTMPDTSGGITWDLTWDATWAGEASAGGRITNRGDCATFPVITFRGPVATPGVAWGGRRVSLGLTLTSGQAVTLDCRPWVNTATRAEGGSVAGLLRGDRLADMGLPPGETEVQFSGSDDTGTAQCEIRWRSASSAP